MLDQMPEMTEITSSLEEAFPSDNTVEELFGSKILRWYQIAARNEVEYIIENFVCPRILLVMPTGTGKTATNGTILLSQRVKKALTNGEDRPLRVLFVSHMKRLLTQAERAYQEESGIVTVTSQFNSTATDHQVEIYYQSAFSDIPDGLEFDLVIIDEGHHEPISNIQCKLDILGTTPIILLTATPDRPDGHILKADHIVNPISREAAVAEGFLAETDIHTFVDVPGRSKVSILTDMVTNFGHLMGKTMMFVRTKKEVTALHDVITKLGYASVALLSQTPTELNIILDDFSEGKYQFIINCARIGEGVDVKNCESVVLGRTIGSYPLLSQLVGRASRPDSACRVWELVNPLSANNLDSTVVVGIPRSHVLYSKERGAWIERRFDYSSITNNKQLGIASGIRIRHH